MSGDGIARARVRDAGESFLGTFASSDGRTTYELLTDLVPRDVSVTVVDLACGHGTLSRNIVARNPRANVAGFDRSADEIALARERVPEGAFTVADAASLPFRDAGADVIVCHMALMLVPVPPVIAEVARIAADGAAFGAIVPAIRRAQEPLAGILAELRATMQRRPEPARGGEGEALQRLPELLRGHGFSDVVIDDVDVPIAIAPHLLSAPLTSSYFFSALTVERQQAVRAQIECSAERAADTDGVLRLAYPLSFFRARRTRGAKAETQR